MACRDLELARKVDGVDIIVGGHTHDYLGPKSSKGRHPIVEHSPSGKPVLVVTAGALAKYLGQLDVTFDAQRSNALAGTALPHAGYPFPPDPAVEAKIAQYAQKLEAFTSVTVGQNNLNA